MTSSLAPTAADDLDHIVERPRRVQRIDAGPQAGCAEVVRLGHLDEACARRLLGVGRDRVLEIAEHHVDLRDQLRHLGAQLLDLRRHEMDHALELDRQLAQRHGAPIASGLKKLRGSFMGVPIAVPCQTASYGNRNASLAKLLLRSPAGRLTSASAADRQPA